MLGTTTVGFNLFPHTMTNAKTGLEISTPFHLNSEFLSHSAQLIESAKYEIFMSDPTWETWKRASKPLFAQLENFLRSSSRAQLRITLNEPERIRRDMPHLATLLTNFQHQAQAKQPRGALAAFPETLLIVDFSSALRRPQAHFPNGVVRRLDIEYAQVQRERFVELWESSEVAFQATTLGL